MKPLLVLLISWSATATCLAAAPLAGTAPLDWEGDISSRLVDSADAFLLEKIEETLAAGGKNPDRSELARILGVVDARVSFEAPEILATVAETEGLVVRAIRWPAFADVHGEGLLLEPKGEVRGNAIAIPDADETPEMLAGLVEGPRSGMAEARALAEDAGFRVVVPTLINRAVGAHTLANREFIYRPAFVLGRHIIGYELQKVLAAIDWMDADDIRIYGHGEGGMLALFAAALDERIGHADISGYTGPAADIWQEPAYRNVFGLLRHFDRESLLTMIAPRKAVILPVPGPEVVVAPGESKGKPGRLKPSGQLPPPAPDAGAEAMTIHQLPDADRRHARQLHELDRHNQQLLVESPYVRAQFMEKLDTGSLEAFEESAGRYRDYFAEKVIGRFDDELLPPNPRTREIEINDKVRAYEVVLDVYEDAAFFAYGILIVPNDLKEGEQRPCVVCQHGLEGRPQSLIGEVDFDAYKAFATKLAERGYVTFAPQNLYLFGDRFRTLQFKANAIGRTLFSLMVPQHQQITSWLGELDFVDAGRIGFYGLSYGGKSAMRIPPLVPGYCLSVCSADFNDWVWKNASTRSPYSYVRTGEYEIFEFDLGSTFNYSEMAALIAPRPFMVERGHFDGVAPDERVASEFAKVRHLYQAKLGIGERAAIEWFVGPHTINGVGTFEFLDRHLGMGPQE
ncbi:hypothetical protein BH23VER1_BH23VER1_11890 [soil metagenome]